MEHVEFEGPGWIEPWVRERGHDLRRIYLWRGDELPRLEDCDWLVVMGGPMSVNEDPLYPWLGPEKRLIAEAIRGGKGVLGICLGAQLIAAALGAQVAPGAEKEIGWWPVRKLPTDNAAGAGLAGVFPEEFRAFHWHGDQFEIPSDAQLFLESEGCRRQAFCVGDRVLALQFHIESTPESVAQLIHHCGGELEEGGKWVQDAETMQGVPAPYFEEAHRILGRVLARMEKAVCPE